MIPKLTLMSGNDIPFREGGIVLHQPRLREIAHIGEDGFFAGTNFLLFDKETMLQEPVDMDNFTVFLEIMKSKEAAKHKADAMMVLTLLFPNAEIKIDDNKILLQTEETKGTKFTPSINKYNFESFQEIITEIFCMDSSQGKESYNPADGMAKKIADKFKKRKQTLSKKKGEDKKEVTILSDYLSILSVGLQKDVNSLLEYTIYQITNEYNRFMGKTSYDFYNQLRLAGAQDLEEVPNWMSEL